MRNGEVSIFAIVAGSERVHGLQAANEALPLRQRATIADVACYRDIAHAPEYAQVRAWLARIAGLPGFVPIATTRVGLVGQ